jgi:hypothetical protein
MLGFSIVRDRIEVRIAKAFRTRRQLQIFPDGLNRIVFAVTRGNVSTSTLLRLGQLLWYCTLSHVPVVALAPSQRKFALTES